MSYWDAADYYFKEDYTIVPKPRAVVYRDRNDQRKLMRLNELHKFSDGTLTRVMEKLDHMVKDFHLFEYNKGMESRKWSEDDKRRSKDFITAIEKRLQIRRIFRSLESFVGGRIRDIDYRLINRTTRTVPKDRPCILLNWSYKVGKVAVSSSLRLLEPKRTIESRAKRSSINLVRTQHPSETMVFHNEDGNPARANIKQALGYLKDGDGDGNSQHLRYQYLCSAHRYISAIAGITLYNEQLNSMSTSHISSYSDFDNESTVLSVSYIILLDSEVKNIASPAALTPPLADYVLVLPDYIPVSDIETEPFEAPTSPNYTPGSDTKIEPFEEDP
ncbi:hypothetical protein Tco_0651762 [Tanacetum coccineum]|uniref:Uncharacterized protein n=1 Tax=Tanacetum coccineum TaxID=301880 RepID=A0ABQ4WW06_9ASTR